MSLPALALPDVWRASELAQQAGPVLPSGHDALDALLPGGGWPVGGISELLQAPAVHAEWGLLAPALSQLVGKLPTRTLDRSAVVLIGAPFVPFGLALAARMGVPETLLKVQADALSDRLWAAEQALRCADVQAVLLWLASVPAAHLRRLQTLAQTHGRLLFVCRPAGASHQPSPAPLRLMLDWQPAGPGATPLLQIQVLKRRGPPVAAPLALPVHSVALRRLLAASHARSHRMRAAARQVAQVVPEVSDAVDRAQSLA